MIKKLRYEYYNGSTDIMDNEVNELVEDVVDVLNTKHWNIMELIKLRDFYQDIIDDLEAKLAEKEKEADKYWEFFNQEAKECAELKKQLAEKEKEISNLKGLVNERDKQIKNLKTNKKRVIEHKNNVKISFAVEQLEKVKELCKKKFDWWENSEWEGDIYDKSDVSNAYFDIEANIDNQIKQLKEMN